MRQNNFSFARKNTAWVRNEEVFVVTRYSEAFVEDCRVIEGRYWDAAVKANVFPLSSAPMVKALCEKWHLPVPVELNYQVAKDNSEVRFDPLQVRLQGDNVVIAFTYDPDKIAAIKNFVPGVKWSSKDKHWITGKANLTEALRFAGKYNLCVEDSLAELAKSVAQESMQMQIASSALTGEIDIPNIAQDLLPYQKAGVLYLKKARKSILGDQPGLGKTVQAIATVASEHRFPAVVVCPNTLKLNWEREINKFFPNLSVVILNGTKSQPIEQSDVVVINYDILYERIGDIMQHGFVSLIVDESHAIKNGVKKHACPECHQAVRSNAKNCSACGAKGIKPEEKWTVKRTAAVMKLAKSLSPEDFVLLLTGTPITNRPEELIPQLEAIGRLENFGGVYRFKSRYAPKRNIALNTKELNDKLRELCFVRRAKKDVYGELPPLRNAVQLLEVSNKSMRWYQKIESDAVEYFAQRAMQLAEETGENGEEIYWQKKISLEYAAHIIKITALRDAVSKIKYDAINDWLKNFLESSDNEKVIVFAEHIELVEKLYEQYSDIAVKIRGGVSTRQRQEAVDRFQTDPTCRVFVANMQAASEGLTLTAASDIVFCELAWTPAMHEQCASRAYGRVNDMHGATAWYLLAPHTIDEQIYALLEKKQKVVNSVTDGVDVTEGRGVMVDLMIELARRGMKHE